MLQYLACNHHYALRIPAAPPVLRHAPAGVLGEDHLDGEEAHGVVWGLTGGILSLLATADKQA
jgi:hypothetical protein